MELVQERELQVGGATAHVHVGGTGSALLLVHGGWGGARTSWSRCWERLARTHQVIAPELPGLGRTEDPPLASVPAYARWAVQLLDALQVERAFCVGNSFGGTVAWSLAGRFPERCAGLVLVDGFRMPRTPWLLLHLGRTAPGRTLAHAIARRVSYVPERLAQAFADPHAAPPEIARMLSERDPAMLRNFVPVLVEGDGGPAPQLTPHFVWGEADHLPGSSVERARQLHARLPGSSLTVVPRAGHFPQLEAPDAFVDALEACLQSPAPQRAA